MEQVVAERLDAVAYSRETHGHIQRVSRRASQIAKEMGLETHTVVLIEKASAYHDVGKNEVPDAILNKPGALNLDERRIMEQHAKCGWAYLMPGTSPLFRAGAIIARQHHERFDGSGYPDGLIGSKIHLFGRIVAVADVFDALISDRPYKKSWTRSAALDHFASNRGILYDPEVVDAFFRTVTARIKP